MFPGLCIQCWLGSISVIYLRSARIPWGSWHFSPAGSWPFCWCWAPNSGSETQLMGNVILLRLGEQQWRDANLRKKNTEMGHDCFTFRKLLCDPAGLVLGMQGYSDKFPLLIVENFLLTSSLQFLLCFQPNQYFLVIGSSVNTGDSCTLQEKLQVKVEMNLWSECGSGCRGPLHGDFAVEQCCAPGQLWLARQGAAQALPCPLCQLLPLFWAIRSTREEAWLKTAWEPRWGCTPVIWASRHLGLFKANKEDWIL